MSSAERAQALIDANDDERVRNGRISWFRDNIQIVRIAREGLKQRLKNIADKEIYLADEAYSLLATGIFDLDKIDQEGFLKFVVDTTRDNHDQEVRKERQKNHFA